MSAAETFEDATIWPFDWREHAVCKGRTELFFGRRAERPEARARREAKARTLCAVCPVQRPCRDWARENREYGFWGGESEEDRYHLGYTVTAAVGVRSSKHTTEATGA